MNRDYNPKSIFAPYILQYIKLKETKGFDTSSIMFVLYNFDRLAEEQKIATPIITREFCSIWLQEQARKGLKTSTLANRCCQIRGFASFLTSLGFASFQVKSPPIKNDFVPHIYSKEEMDKIFSACDRITARYKHRHLSGCSMMPCMIRTLYATGIRIGEAMKLCHSDIDLSRKMILVRCGKNRIERILPFKDSLKIVLRDYIQYKENLHLPIDGDSTLFVSDGGRPMSHTAISCYFRRILYAAGIPKGSKNNGPRLHDLRHTFAVNALMNLLESGMGFSVAIFTLMAYMGHSDIKSTNAYLRITEEAYPGILSKMSEIDQLLFKNLQETTAEHYEEEYYCY